MVRLVGIGSRVSREVYERICEEAKAKKTTRSEIIRQHLTEYYDLKAENAKLEEQLDKVLAEGLRLKKENEKLKKRIEELERSLVLRKEIEKQKEQERRSRLWRWLEEHLR